MYRHILVPTDGSRLSLKAAAHAIALAKATGARLTGFHASPDYPLPVYADGVVFEPLSRKDYAAQCKKEADRILSDVAVKARAARVAFAGVSAISASPWEAILAAAKTQKCDAIVMASHGRRGVAALVLGSETQKVLTHSKLPVLVVR
ncbi:MAG TPA: universal stress protein [Casimicrobiaceae bacterium]|nr:universal stress protein [Casimicrobiaceae bacterium]